MLNIICYFCNKRMATVIGASLLAQRYIVQMIVAIISFGPKFSSASHIADHKLVVAQPISLRGQFDALEWSLRVYNVAHIKIDGRTDGGVAATTLE